jgi:hypothetical protein
MIPQAQPTISFATRVPVEVDARRRRLQRQTGCAVPDLLDKALRALEISLNSADNAPAGRALTPEQEAATPMTLNVKRPHRDGEGANHSRSPKRE